MTRPALAAVLLSAACAAPTVPADVEIKWEGSSSDMSRARRRRKHEKGVAYVAELINHMFHPPPGAPTSTPNVWAMGAEIRKVTRR